MNGAKWYMIKHNINVCFQGYNSGRKNGIIIGLFIGFVIGIFTYLLIWSL